MVLLVIVIAQIVVVLKIFVLVAIVALVIILIDSNSNSQYSSTIPVVAAVDPRPNGFAPRPPSPPRPDI